MKQISRITAMGTVVLLVGSMMTSSFGAELPSEKEEVIYVMTDANGEVISVNAVNIFGGGDILDYGSYSEVKMLTTEDEIQQQGNKITISSEADRVYYQGTMKNAEIPWNISIRYYLDEKEYEPEELAGKSGELEIKIKITENSKADSSFYENYALQATVTLDTETCSNIEAADATIANVGKNTQLAYTILPNRGIDTVIRATVSDFEMEAIAINGIRLNLDVEVDDTEITKQLNDMIDAANMVNDGAVQIKDGTGTLYSATGTLNESVGQLNTGMGQLANGADELSGGLATLNANSKDLTTGAYQAFAGLCTASEQALNTELAAAGMPTVTLTPENYAEVLNGLLKSLGTDVVYQQAYNQALEQVTKAVEEQADTLYTAYINANAESIYATVLPANTPSSVLTEQQKQAILLQAKEALTDEQKAQIKQAYIQQKMTDDAVTAQIAAVVKQADEVSGKIAELKGGLDGYKTFYTGLQQYVAGVGSAADGAATLSKGTREVYDNMGKLYQATGTLNGSTKELLSGTEILQDGTATFASEVSGADDKVNEQIDSVLSDIRGSSEVVSFVSDKNTNVDAVQFVIKTAAIETEEAETADADSAAKPTFWEKLWNLFKSDKTE